MKVKIVNRCDSGKEPTALWLWAELTNRHRNSQYNIAVKHNRRPVLRDEQTGHFLYSADYSKTWYRYFVGFAYTGEVFFLFSFIYFYYFSVQYGGFIAFDKLKSYNNATWLQLTCRSNVIFCSGRLSDV